MEIQKDCSGKKVHALDVAHFDILLCEGIEHIEKLLLAFLRRLEERNVREGSMHVLSNFSSCAVISFQPFQCSVEVRFFLLAIKELGLEVPELNPLYGGAEAQDKKSSQLSLEYLVDLKAIVAGIVCEALSKSLLY